MRRGGWQSLLQHVLAKMSPVTSNVRRDIGRELHLQFLRSPEQILPRAPGSRDVGGVRLQVNALQNLYRFSCLNPYVEITTIQGSTLQVNELRPRPDGSQRAVGTGRYETLPVGFAVAADSRVCSCCR